MSFPLTRDPPWYSPAIPTPIARGTQRDIPPTVSTQTAGGRRSKAQRRCAAGAKLTEQKSLG